MISVWQCHCVRDFWKLCDLPQIFNWMPPNVFKLIASKFQRIHRRVFTSDMMMMLMNELCFQWLHEALTSSSGQVSRYASLRRTSYTSKPPSSRLLIKLHCNTLQMKEISLNFYFVGHSQFEHFSSKRTTHCCWNLKRSNCAVKTGKFNKCLAI